MFDDCPKLRLLNFFGEFFLEIDWNDGQGFNLAKSEYPSFYGWNYTISKLPHFNVFIKNGLKYNIYNYAQNVNTVKNPKL